MLLTLWPVPQSVFMPAMEGRDLIGRAKTGSGKTLAFALPVIENLIQVSPQRQVWAPSVQSLTCALASCTGGPHDRAEAPEEGAHPALPHPRAHA
jgi:hypothetical protein